MSGVARFMFLFRGGAATNPTLSDVRRQAQIGKWHAWTNELRTGGHLLVGGYPLEVSSQLIRGASARRVEAHTPDAGELVTGNLVVQADSLPDALTLAQGCPILDVGGSVEVRQILERPR